MTKKTSKPDTELVEEMPVAPEVAAWLDADRPWTSEELERYSVGYLDGYAAALADVTEGRASRYDAIGAAREHLNGRLTAWRDSSPRENPAPSMARK